MVGVLRLGSWRIVTTGAVLITPTGRVGRGSSKLTRVRDPNDDISRRVAQAAGRLRLTQQDFADDPEEVRREHLGDVVKEAMADLMPDQREAFLERLEEVFPSWDENVSVAPEAAAPASVRSTVDDAELKDPSFLVERLRDLAPSMSEEQRLAAAKALAGVGISVPSSGDWPAEAAAGLAAKLPSPSGAGLDPARSVELALLLLEFVLSLEQVVWGTWKQMAPRSVLRRTSPLGPTLGAFATGEEQTPRSTVEGELERLRQVAAAMVAAIRRAGFSFAQKHVEDLSPATIESVVAQEKSLMVSREVRCWRKYRELAESLDPTSMNAELLQAIVDHTEELVLGRNR